MRKELSAIDYQHIQQVFQKHGKDKLPPNERKALLMDATCLESNLRYPTDVKLLFEPCQWLNGQLLGLCTSLALAKTCLACSSTGRVAGFPLITGKTTYSELQIVNQKTTDELYARQERKSTSPSEGVKKAGE
ncbi:MAG: hypothetical protein ICV84_24095 [Flavisolibacter sp.]|nr:hypothetical protein [Flavisolibacter sp.]